MRKISMYLGCLVMLLAACKKEDKLAQAIEAQEVNLKVLRFDVDFSKATPTSLRELQKKYPYLFPQQYADSIWISKMQDTLQRALLEEVEAEFKNFETEKEALEQLFKHITYYFPTYSVPQVVTVTSDVDYNNRIILTDSLLLIGLDNYLGKEHRFYAGIERYLAKKLDKKYLISDVASAFSKKVLRNPNSRTFLAQMIYYGKELYLKDKLMPFQSDAQKIGYTEEELTWAQDNEEQIWRYFIERELLYSTDNTLTNRFLDPAPFSKFRLELIDSESPGRIGRYMGWQVVKAFMENNEVSLQQMLLISAEELFKKSKYKPKK